MSSCAAVTTTQLLPEDYEALASFRYAMRKFLNFSKRALAAEADLTPEQYEALLALKAYSGPSGLTVTELSERLQTLYRRTEETPLSVRESEVLSLIAKGFSFGEIARLLGVSQHTVISHVKKIYQKLAVHSRGEAVYEAGKMGLI